MIEVLTQPATLSAFALAALLTVIAWIDLRTLRIPDWSNAALGVTGFAVTAWLGRDLVLAGLGVACGYAAFWAVAAAFSRWRGYDGLGLGDAKLLAAGGAWVGVAGLPFVVLTAAITGLALVAGLWALGRPVGARTALPFGPFLALGIGLVWGLQQAGVLV